MNTGITQVEGILQENKQPKTVHKNSKTLAVSRNITTGSTEGILPAKRHYTKQEGVIYGTPVIGLKKSYLN
jgi:hypothetical protein